MIDPPPAPDFEVLPKVIGEDLDGRLQLIPFGRIRRYADYWALRDVEIDHIRNLARHYELSDEDHDSVEAWWMTQLAMRLSPTLERLTQEDRDTTRRLLRRRAGRKHSKIFFQLWFNTVGPGGRCWFGNRYTSIRHYTFRLHWRP